MLSVLFSQLFRRLSSIEGMNNLVELQVLSMSNHLLKIARYKQQEVRSRDGRVQLDRNNVTFLHELILADKSSMKLDASGINLASGVRKHRVSESASADWLMNAEFHPSPVSTSPMPDTLSLNAQPTPTLSLVEYSMPERGFQQERVAECRSELDQLCQRLKGK